MPSTKWRLFRLALNLLKYRRDIVYLDNDCTMSGIVMVLVCKSL